ncbi:anaphase-promoting complex subunit 6-like [Nilaparvata lugens]|uniref:anaphase-promoting complex subunit 6-like n=1 Tax=Nilaparvata lugens TaxID=108931 RepID=UPI00193CBB53|nr:anaphase-promoting complex subunit 6-like [Nilaparvata lugens]
MTKSSEGRIIRKIYIGGKEHEILYSENKLEEEFNKIDELEERKIKIQDCLRLKVEENERIEKENEKLICNVEDETNELIKLRTQLMKDREYYELKRTQFCKKMMRNHKRSVGLLTEDSVESIASRLEQSNSLPSLNCKRLLYLYKQWRMITYNNCENYLRLDQYRNEVISEISTIRREFKKAKFETLSSHKESTLQYLYLIGKQRTGKGQIKMHKKKENDIVERMKLLKIENEKLKKLFQVLYDRIGSVDDDDEDDEHDFNHANGEESNKIVNKTSSKCHDSDKKRKQNVNNEFDTSVTTSSSESVLFDDPGVHEKDSRVSMNDSYSSESYDNSYLAMSNNRANYSIYNCTNSEVQLNRNTSLELNVSDSFSSLYDLKKSRKLKTDKRRVRFREKAVCMNGDEVSEKSSTRTIQEEEVTAPGVTLGKTEENNCEEDNVVQKDSGSVEDLVKQSWKDEFSGKSLTQRTSSLHSDTSGSLNNKHDSGIDNASSGSSLRDLSLDELIKVQDRIFKLEMSLKLNDCKNYSTKVKLCQNDKTD